MNSLTHVEVRQMLAQYDLITIVLFLELNKLSEKDKGVKHILIFLIMLQAKHADYTVQMKTEICHRIIL